jgi:hypothetical protein
MYACGSKLDTCFNHPHNPMDKWEVYPIKALSMAPLIMVTLPTGLPSPPGVSWQGIDVLLHLWSLPWTRLILLTNDLSLLQSLSLVDDLSGEWLSLSLSTNGGAHNDLALQENRWLVKEPHFWRHWFMTFLADLVIIFHFWANLVKNFRHNSWYCSRAFPIPCLFCEAISSVIVS